MLIGASGPHAGFLSHVIGLMPVIMVAAVALWMWLRGK